MWFFKFLPTFCQKCDHKIIWAFNPQNISQWFLTVFFSLSGRSRVKIWKKNFFAFWVLNFNFFPFSEKFQIEKKKLVSHAYEDDFQCIFDIFMTLQNFEIFQILTTEIFPTRMRRLELIRYNIQIFLKRIKWSRNITEKLYKNT